MKLQIMPVLNKIFIKGLCFTTPFNKNHMKFKPLYKFCNILIPGRVGNFGPVDTSSSERE